MNSNSVSDFPSPPVNPRNGKSRSTDQTSSSHGPTSPPPNPVTSTLSPPSLNSSSNASASTSSPTSSSIRRTVGDEDIAKLYDSKTWNRRSALAVTSRPQTHEVDHGTGRPGALLSKRTHHPVTPRKASKSPRVHLSSSPNFRAPSPPSSDEEESEADSFESLFGPEPPSPIAPKPKPKLKDFLRGLEISFPPGSSDGIFDESTTPNYPLSLSESDSLTPNPHEVNYMDILPLRHKSSIKWLKKIGHYIAQFFLLPLFPSGVFPDHVEYRLKSWPDGYRLYIHRSGDRQCPRKDLYLYGSKRVKCFRSPEEFFEHAVWLMKGGEGSGEDCECQHCAGEESLNSMRGRKRKTLKILKA
ncbi:hypothetical protein SISSUDRAFT_1122140 [Sistotremastrum suecicum HHB10207 ss-3]|uniref:Cryptic loci regulator 2 N-terminal domain-containing protein n=1 Tax=Sistotremastrum suecicum HHB10207 ss-3 TaxID=1314776 RepID=A0A165ZT30_9AGAM|nr:hypothetical protein SISSUDRAFT_1122140 [Sistotremastrum suecicum HHB10207 ss-3]